MTVLGGRAGYDHTPPARGDDEPVTIDAVPPADVDGRTDTDPRDREVSA